MDKKEIHIDLNSDLGEHPGADLDKQIMPFLSSCNIACGGHAGDAASVKQSILLALQYGVAIGAHPSYPDRENFGRTVLDVSSEELEESLYTQINLVKEVCKSLGAKLHHIKPHGALYNEAAKNKALSTLLCQMVKKVDPLIKLYGLAHSLTEKVAKEHGIEFIAEAFADRRYEADKTLLSRRTEGAVLVDEMEVLHQIEELVLNQRVYADDWVAIKAQTICLHSDTRGAVNLAEKIRNHLEKKGVHIVAV